MDQITETECQRKVFKFFLVHAHYTDWHIKVYLIYRIDLAKLPLCDGSPCWAFPKSYLLRSGLAQRSLGAPKFQTPGRLPVLRAFSSGCTAARTDQGRNLGSRELRGWGFLLILRDPVLAFEVTGKEEEASTYRCLPS